MELLEHSSFATGLARNVGDTRRRSVNASSVHMPSSRATHNKAMGSSDRRARGRGNVVANHPPRSQGRRMDLVASVSRSSGLEKDGDT